MTQQIPVLQWEGVDGWWICKKASCLSQKQDHLTALFLHMCLPPEPRFFLFPPCSELKKIRIPSDMWCVVSDLSLLPHPPGKEVVMIVVLWVFLSFPFLFPFFRCPTAGLRLCSSVAEVFSAGCCDWKYRCRSTSCWRARGRGKPTNAVSVPANLRAFSHCWSAAGPSAG